MYFDYAATTPPNSEVLKTFDTVNRDFWANPHALHRLGMRAESLLEQSRQQVLSLLSATKEYRCVFTSGATESNNTALKSAAKLYKHRGNHIITSALEHPSVSEVCKYLESEGFDLTILPVTPEGAVDPAVLQEALRAETILVSLMHVNNEIGSINDIIALGDIVKKQSNALFHVDAAQSIGKLPLTLDGSPIDMLTFSAHKFFGLKGSGALILKSRLKLPPLLHGGGQEEEFRSGTADTPRAASLAKALRLATETQDGAYTAAQGFKKRIAETLLAIDGVTLNGSLENSSPFILNVSIDGVRPETVLHGLAEQEIYISTVSACSARKTEVSSVVLALTQDQKRAKSSIRISLSAITTIQEVDALIATLPTTIKKLRFVRK